MKMLRIFLRDLTVSLRSFISAWIIVAPLMLAVLINLATPGITDSLLVMAHTPDLPEDKAAFYARYAKLETVANEDALERRVMTSDLCFGLVKTGDNWLILAQGDEPAELLDAVKLLKTCEEKGLEPSGQVVFSDLGRATSPLKTTLVTSLMIMVTVLSGMLIAINIVDEKTDGTIRAIKVAPVSMTSFVVGKSLIGLAFTLIVGAAILVITGFAGAATWPILPVLVASSATSFIIGFLAGLTADDFISAAGNVKIIMLPAMAPILVTELADPKWHKLVWWSPFYWSYDAVKGLLDGTATMGRVLLDCGVVILIAAILYLTLLPRIRRALD